MSDEPNMAKFRSALFVGGLLLLSCFMCYDEIAYLLNGHEAEATVTKTYATGRRGKVSVEYTWSEPEGLQRKSMYATSPENTPSVGTKFAIVYTRGELGRARPEGNVPWIAIGLLCTALIGVAVVVVLLLREANEGDRPRPARRR
jgi:hypothetical protein